MSEPVTRERSCDGFYVTWDVRDMGEPWLVHTSLPHDLPEHKLAVLSLIQAEAVPAGAFLGERFLLSEYIIHPVVIHNPERKNPTVGRRLVIPREGNIPLDVVSETAIRSLGSLAATSGREPPWYPPLVVYFRRRFTRKSANYELRLVK